MEQEKQDKENEVEKTPVETPNEEHQLESPVPKKSNSDIIIIYSVLVIFIIFISIVFIPRLLDLKPEISLDGLHMKNMDGELSDEEGYMHEGVYSFVKFDDLWYTQLVTQSGEKLFNIPFHYRPDEVDHITPTGNLNRTNLERWKNFFNTFDPLDDHLGHIGVATGETNGVIAQVFGKGVIGACTSHEDPGCVGRPIVMCNLTDAPVFHYKSEIETKVEYDGNCITVSGNKEELWKATDRMLYDLLGIIK